MGGSKRKFPNKNIKRTVIEFDKYEEPQKKKIDKKDLKDLIDLWQESKEKSKKE